MGKLLVDSIAVTKECVQQDIFDANIFHSLMFRWINGLVAINGFERAFEGMFPYIRYALETKYIFALAKLFANSKEAGLWKFIQQAKEYPQAAIEIKLERKRDSLQDHFKRQRREFLKNFSTYEKRIKKIRDIIEPYRNIQRAHNLPWRQKDGKKVTWNDTQKWLRSAETVFVQAVEGICDSCRQVGDFDTTALDGQMDYFVSLIKPPLEAAEAERPDGLKNQKL